MPTFDIGLVMAGAVSAGAYTAGAVDFLLQALDVWAAEKQRDPDCPRHDIRLKVMTGASAGAITAAIVATVLGEELPPVDDYPSMSNGARNKLFDAWVNRVDITGLLGHQDLDDDPGPVRSLLDSTALDRIGDRVFQPGSQRATPRMYMGDPAYFSVTLTNLRGVPYEIDFTGLGGPRMPHVMTLHADTMTFAVQRRGRVLEAGIDPIENALPLDSAVGTGNWQTLRTAALASGAFPIGLLPRALARPAAQYRNRRWFFPHPRTVNGKHECGYFGTLSPAFGDPPDFNYDFLNVDGGTMDNEPVGRARELLTPNDPTGIETAGESAAAAIVMIDPFPNTNNFDRNDDFHKSFTLLRLAPRILHALISQARFKPEELTRAIDPDNYNQFLIAPARSGGPAAKNFPIASGGLGGFAGFLARDFRAHDFQLGRRNTQQFLRRHFVFPEVLSDGRPNPLFVNWSPAARDRHRVWWDAKNRFVDPATKKVKDEAGHWVDPQQPVLGFLPIVPLLGRAAQDEQSPTWPTYPRKKLDDLRTQITGRAKHVAERLISNVNGRLTRFFLRRAWWLKRSDIIQEHFLAPIRENLDMRGLLGE